MDNQQENKPTVPMKLCPECKAAIPASAKKCSHCGSDVRSWPRRHLVGLMILGTIAFFVILAIDGSQSNNNSGSSTTNSTTNSVVTTPVSICDTPVAIITQQEKSVDYKQLAKDPGSFDGTVTTFTGQIVQIQQSGNQGIIRLAVTKTDYGWNSSDIVYVTYNQPTQAVQDDIVTVTGPLTGSETYTSEANYQITVPSMNVCSVTVSK